MTTYQDILNSFYSRFQSTKLLPEGLVKEFFNQALGDFEIDLYPLGWNIESQEFDEILERSIINLLGRLMYASYLSREVDRIVKLTNIVGKDISLTGMGDSKRFSMMKLAEEESKINEMKSKLKTSSYYE
ncbi:hypothetical protein [Paenibacillus sp. O199]|uniref:hypothetical protein n=1 Tax=Paenibacillus sp. O199 TaxID=1643925 RepID=UPI0007BFD0B9|nr:hypothetical protein [Paenibacillus sp. O199]